MIILASLPFQVKSLLKLAGINPTFCECSLELYESLFPLRTPDKSFPLTPGPPNRPRVSMS